MRTTVYIDGLNLYNGCLKRPEFQQFKWLDLYRFSQNILGRKHNVDTIKYFTAVVQGRPDPGAPQRQTTYINALKHSYPDVISVITGYFTTNKKRMPKADPPHKTIEVIKTEEKGTDVNLAVHLLNDAWLNSFDCGVVVSNDADMAEAMSLVRQHHQTKFLGLVNPCEGKTLQNLRQHAHFARKIRRNNLANAQLPQQIAGTNIHKPPSW